MILLLYILKKMLTEFIFGMSKDDAINIMTGSDLVDKRGVR